MGRLILPRRNVQMAIPIVFWYSKTLLHILVPPHWSVPAPEGYQRIECRHAHEVDLWSDRLRQQEKRIREMNEEERYNFEEPIRAHGIAMLRKALATCSDQVNREFIAISIKNLERKREKRRKEYVETYMAVEARENVGASK